MASKKSEPKNESISEAFHQLLEKGFSEEAVINIITNTLKAACKRRYGTAENCIVKISEDFQDVSVFQRKVIVDGVYDPNTEIEIDEAKELNPDSELGLEIDIPINLSEFDRSAVQTGKQTAHQSFTEIQKDSLYAEYKMKIGETIIGYYQRERKDTIYVDLGKVEGVLPPRNQLKTERYEKNDRIKALIVDVKKSSSGLQIILSRTDPDFVRSLLEVEVPELYDKTVEIFKVVREPGYRTKVAVFSKREDIDPVGSCVGLKGGRIKGVITELGNEKIDVLKYDPDPRVFIKNALSPAEVSAVYIRDEGKRQALAVVPENQFSLAIGKQGLNVRLANRLCDWNIDVKTEEECSAEELDELVAESRKAVQELFNDDYDEITTIQELPDVDENVAAILKENNIVDIEDFMAASENGELANIQGLTEENIATLLALIESSVEFIEEEEAESDVDSSDAVDSDDNSEEVYECPECGAAITIDMTTCPNCGVGLSFEEEE